MRRARLLLADDHGGVAEALGSMLGRDYDVVATVHDGHELVEAARRLRPDVIVADISMPELTGLDALRQLEDVEKIDAKVIFLTMYSDPELAAEAFRAGGSGYVLKDSAPDELHIAIEEALQGRSHLSSRIAKGVISALASHTGGAVAQLTARQKES